MDGETMTHHDGQSDNTHDDHAAAPDELSNGAGSESPEEGAAAQKAADDASDTGGSPTGDIG
jgi:hypothetical protein